MWIVLSILACDSGATTPSEEPCAADCGSDTGDLDDTGDGADTGDTAAPADPLEVRVTAITLASAPRHAAVETLLTTHGIPTGDG